MSKGRLQNTGRKTRRSPPAVTGLQHRFIGVSLSGGKTDKTAIAVVEFFPDHKKVFLARLFDKIKSEPPHYSSDQKVHEILSPYQGEAEVVAFDVPLSLPKCIDCKLTCPGYELCNETEIKWLRAAYQKINLNKKPKRIFTPYTQRCSETYWSLEFPQVFELQHALGANLAPLTARALFIKKRLQMNCIEVIPRLTVWQLGLKYKVNKSQLKFHRHSVGGEESRKAFLQALTEKTGVFIYQQDLKVLIEHAQAFDSFICAYTGFLHFTDSTIPRPTDFPKNENWIAVPLK
jgi:hypothetical protein